MIASSSASESAEAGAAGAVCAQSELALRDNADINANIRRVGTFFILGNLSLLVV